MKSVRYIPGVIGYLGIWLVAASSAYAQPSAKVDEPIFEHPQSAKVGEPISKLPKGINAPAGKVSLVADFAASAAASSSNAPGPKAVYLVNRSDHDIDLVGQDGDVCLKLETLAASGEWIRAQPHRFSDCGNSYSNLNVRRDHFYVIKGYQPEAGTKARTRYRLYNQHGLDLVTEAGDGLCLDADIKKASVDELAIGTGSFEFVAGIAKGENKLVDDMDDSENLKLCALRSLTSGRFSAKEVIPVLDQVRTNFSKYWREEIDFHRRLLLKKN